MSEVIPLSDKDSARENRLIHLVIDKPTIHLCGIEISSPECLPFEGGHRRGDAYSPLAGYEGG